MNRVRGLISLSPLAVFLAVYLLSSIISGDFYRIPVSSAFLIACIYAVLIAKGTISERISIFSRGAGDSNVLLMIWIFILAGAFAGTAKAIGAVDATVNLTLGLFPPSMLYAGLFITSCFISMAIGTSVGTIVALAPIGAGVAAQTGCAVPYMAAIIVGGAFFGDNLSFISDTTIASTKAMGCEMKDKFKTNILIVLPAVIVVTSIYFIQGQTVDVALVQSGPASVKVLPYIAVIIMALLGLEVTLILTIGIALNILLGLLGPGQVIWSQLLVAVGDGISSMSDLILVTLLAGGLLEMIRVSGGLDYIIYALSRAARGPRGAQASIATLVGLANVCTANNTIAIITTGGIARDISDRFGIDPRKTASILDTFSCLVQCVLPYGAQLLMAASLMSITPTSIIPYLYYPMAMGVCAILAIVFNFPRYDRGKTVTSR